MIGANSLEVDGPWFKKLAPGESSPAPVSGMPRLARRRKLVTGDSQASVSNESAGNDFALRHE